MVRLAHADGPHHLANTLLVAELLAVRAHEVPFQVAAREIGEVAVADADRRREGIFVDVLLAGLLHMFARHVDEILLSIPHHAVRRDVADLKHAPVVARRIMLQMNLVLGADLERLAFHAGLHRRFQPFLEDVEVCIVHVPPVFPHVRILVVVVVQEAERLRHVGDSSKMVGMPVRDHEVVDLALRNEAFDVAAHPLAGPPLAGGHRRERFGISRFPLLHVSTVKEHRGSVREDEERVLGRARVNEVDVHLPGFPSGIGASHRVAARRASPDGANRRSRQGIDEEFSSAEFHFGQAPVFSGSHFTRIVRRRAL